MISFPEQFNMADYFRDPIKEGKGDRVAAYYQDKKYTYSDIQRMANRCGNVLPSLGIDIEDSVLMSLPDYLEFVASWFAITKIGAVIAMINGTTGQETTRSSHGTLLNTMVTSA